MNLFVDTSVWSLAWRRHTPGAAPETNRLVHALDYGEEIFAAGIVLQELLQGFTAPKAATDIIERFAAIPLIAPTRTDHIEAAQLRNHCRRSGIQVGTIDALLAQICISRDLVMLSTDADFTRIAGQSSLSVWNNLSADALD